MKKSNFWVFLIFGGFAVFLVIMMLSGGSGDSSALDASIKTFNDQTVIAEEDLKVDLKGVNTPDVKLQDLMDKPVFLNFWGTWCPPCRDEWPTIQRLYDDHGKDMNFVLIAMEDKWDSVEKYLKENNFTVPVYFADSPLPPRFLVKIFPSTYLLDQKGRILQYDEGAQDWDSQKNRTFVEGILEK